MFTPGRKPSLTRRGVFAAGAMLAAHASVARAAAPSAPTAWLAYEERLAGRLADAGGGEFGLKFAKGLLAATNRFRKAQGLQPLAWDPGLAASARAHVADMVQRRYFAHQSPEGFTHIERVSLLNRDLCAQTAENLAYRDYPTERATPEQFQTMWEQSPGHRRNLENPAFGQAGFGAVQIGSAVYVAGLYADVAIRLTQALPLSIQGDEELAGVIAHASPNIERLSLTAPFQQPTWMASAQTLPALPKGVWQLRPLRPAGGTKYDVLPGPLFTVG